MSTDADMVWVIVHYWEAPNSWFPAALSALFLINGPWFGRMQGPDLIWVLSVAFLVVSPWCAVAAKPWWLSATVLSSTLVVPYAVMCTQRAGSGSAGACAMAICNLGLQLFLHDSGQQPYWIHRVVHYNHFFLFGAQGPSLPAWCMLPALLFGATIQPAWDPGYWSGIGRWLHSWSWVILAREACRNLHVPGFRYPNESHLHDAAMYIYLLHPPLMHAVKWLLWQHLHPYWTTLCCSVLPVAVSVLAHYCARRLHASVEHAFQVLSGGAASAQHFSSGA